MMRAATLANRLFAHYWFLDTEVHSAKNQELRQTKVDFYSPLPYHRTNGEKGDKLKRSSRRKSLLWEVDAMTPK